MTKTAIQFTILYIVLALAQAIVFNNVCLFRSGCSLCIHICDNPTADDACRKLGTDNRFYPRPGRRHIFGHTGYELARVHTARNGTASDTASLFPREDELTMPEPSIRSLGPEIYGRYLFTMVLFYCTAIFLIEAFSLFDPLRIMLRVICSTFLTFLLLLGLDSVISRGS